MRHSDSRLNALAVGSTLLCIGMALWIPDTASTMAPWLVLVSVFVIGIPHGAIDHIIASRLYGLNQTLRSHLLFYAGYLLIMLVIGALWIVAPVAGMAFFLLISAYHFGQADAEEFLAQRTGWRHLLTAGRGLFIITLIVFPFPDLSYPIMAEAMRISEGALVGRLPEPSAALWLSAGCYTLSILILLALKQLEKPLLLVADSLLLVALFLITGPLIGFALYFALWHSAGHVTEMRDYLRSQNRSLSVAGFYKKAAPFTLVSIAGLALLAGVQQALQLQEEFLSLLFILISVLTLPHMIIVDKMYTASDS
ncbi:MAG: Brp/Blh family beta-carotene 15,15'-dioxygenase [Balneolaceae bacterium]